MTRDTSEWKWQHECMDWFFKVSIWCQFCFMQMLNMQTKEMGINIQRWVFEIMSASIIQQLLDVHVERLYPFITMLISPYFYLFIPKYLLISFFFPSMIFLVCVCQVKHLAVCLLLVQIVIIYSSVSHNRFMKYNSSRIRHISWLRIRWSSRIQHNRWN